MRLSQDMSPTPRIVQWQDPVAMCELRTKALVTSVEILPMWAMLGPDVEGLGLCGKFGKFGKFARFRVFAACGAGHC